MNKIKSAIKFVVSFVSSVAIFLAFPAFTLSELGLGNKITAGVLVVLTSYVYVVTDASIGFFGSMFGQTIFTQLPWYGWYLVFMFGMVMFDEITWAFSDRGVKIEDEEVIINI